MRGRRKKRLLEKLAGARRALRLMESNQRKWANHGIERPEDIAAYNRAIAKVHRRTKKLPERSARLFPEEGPYPQRKELTAGLLEAIRKPALAPK